jgi:type I restriction enzyme, S subunit
VIHEPNNARFLFYRSCLIDWRKYNEASGVPSLNARTVEEIELKIPKPTEQITIAAILSDMDAEIAALKAKLVKARQIKQGGVANYLVTPPPSAASGIWLR